MAWEILYKWTTSRGTAKEMTAFWLSIWDGFFKVGFLFPVKVREDVLNLPLSPDTKKRIADSEQVGKLKIFSIGFNLRTEESLDEIYTLIAYKKR